MARTAFSVVVALALSASVSAFNPTSTRRFAAPRSARVTARFAEEAAAPAAEAADEAAEPAEPPPPAYQASIALPFMPNPPALDGSMAGDVGFDPIGFSSTFNLLWLREAEIKHGRVCMLAWTGFVATDLGFTLPGEMHQVSSVQAHDVACTYGAMQQLLLWLGFIEVFGTIAASQMCWMGSGRVPGDFGLDPLKFCSTPEKTADMKLKEIVHCRLAMFAASGVITQAVLTGKGFPYWP